MVYFHISAKSVAVIILLIVILAVYIELIMVDAPKSSTLTKDEEDKRVFTIGTIEDIGNNLTVKRFEFDFTLTSETEAIGCSEVWLQNGNGSLNATLIFVLPSDAKPYYPFPLNASSRSYGNVVFLPIEMEANEFEYFTIYFNWASVSKEIGLEKFAFNVEGRAFHYLLDNEKIPFHPLLGKDSVGNLQNIPIGISVMLESEQSLLESYPAISQKFAGSNIWIIQKPGITFQVTGTYENPIAKFNYSTALHIFPFLMGAIVSLLVKLVYDDLKSEKSSKARWIESDYS